MQLISPRRQQIWTATYRSRAARLVLEGRMRPSGRDAIAQSKAFGLWEADADVDALLVPDDLADALDAVRAIDVFAAEPPSYRRNVLRWIKQAKKPDTRARRIEVTVDHARRRARVGS